MNEHPGIEKPPPGVAIHGLAGEHHRRPLIQLPRAGADALGLHLEFGQSGATIQHVELVGVRVTQRPHIGRCGKQQVQREDGNVGGQPVQRVGKPRLHIARPRPDRRRNQREDAFAVGLTGHQIGRSQLGEPSIEDVEALHHTVVCEQPAVLQEGVGVARVEITGRGIPHMSKEGGTAQALGIGGELGVLPGRDRLLVQHRLTGGVERPDPGAVGVASALGGEAVGGVQQPEGRRHHIATGMQAK